MSDGSGVAYWMRDGVMYETTVTDWLAKTEPYSVQSSADAWIICEARRIILQSIADYSKHRLAGHIWKDGHWNTIETE